MENKNIFALGDIVFVTGDKSASELKRFMVGKIVRIPTQFCADYDVDFGDTTQTFSEEFLVKTNIISYLLYYRNK